MARLRRSPGRCLDAIVHEKVGVKLLWRLFADEGLDRIPMRHVKGPKTGLRWQAERPRALWQGDVCYTRRSRWAEKMSVRIPGLLNDASRYIISLEAHHIEREVDIWSVCARHPPTWVVHSKNFRSRGRRDIRTHSVAR